jgi:hypothetical protein
MAKEQAFSLGYHLQIHRIDKQLEDMNDWLYVIATYGSEEMTNGEAPGILQ